MRIYKIANQVPFPLYHGTDRWIEGGSLKNGKGSADCGIYASASRDYALTFGNKVLTVKMSINNPLILDIGNRESKNYTSTQGEIVLDNRIVGFYRKLTNNVVSILKTAGYDGIIANYNGIYGFEVVAFDESQVKIMTD